MSAQEIAFTLTGRPPAPAPQQAKPPWLPELVNLGALKDPHTQFLTSAYSAQSA